MAGPDCGGWCGRKGCVATGTLGCTWEAPSNSCGYTHIQTYMPALVLTSIYIYTHIYVCSRTRPASGVGLEEVGRRYSSSLSGRARCRLSPLESFDPRYQGAGVTRLPSSL